MMLTTTTTTTTMMMIYLPCIYHVCDVERVDQKTHFHVLLKNMEKYRVFFLPVIHFSRWRRDAVTWTMPLLSHIGTLCVFQTCSGGGTCREILDKLFGIVLGQCLSECLFSSSAEEYSISKIIRSFRPQDKLKTPISQDQSAYDWRELAKRTPVYTSRNTQTLCKELFRFPTPPPHSFFLWGRRKEGQSKWEGLQRSETRGKCWGVRIQKNIAENVLEIKTDELTSAKGITYQRICKVFAPTAWTCF